MSAIALFGKMLSFSRLKIMTDDLAVVKSELESLVGGKTPIPVVIDSDIGVDLEALVEMLWGLGIQPIGVVEGALTKQANALRLATFPSDGKRIERLKPTETKTTTSPDHTPNTNDPTKNISNTDSTNLMESVENVESVENINDINTDDTDVATKLADDTNDKFSVDIVTDILELTSPANTPAFADTENLVQAVPTSTEVGSFSQEVFDEEKGMTSSVHNYMLRSGQSIQHLGGDLVIIGGVNNGAEAITDNNLHIYGHGQGRLVAGATGDKDARIFCQKFNPSLVSVAGTYCLREAIPAEMIDKAVQVSYDADKGLIFTLMTH
ncbi:septum site-determining protein MinC [Moraxella oblonga]|uniref:septum site-determining protein MinC n=1 Tax=Moraxella oblonga TaxID=200413 RepID=UPI000832DB4D|nr:septum site-determining protein MinC [Moraxella oblonga]